MFNKNKDALAVRPLTCTQKDLGFVPSLASSALQLE